MFPVLIGARFAQAFAGEPLVMQAQLTPNAVCFATMSPNRAAESVVRLLRGDQLVMNAISYVRKRTMRLLQCVQGGMTVRAR